MFIKQTLKRLENAFQTLPNHYELLHIILSIYKQNNFNLYTFVFLTLIAVYV